jgi:hypothetical protein
MTGRHSPIRNQRRNEEPLILPITPAERPKKIAIATYAPPYIRVEG